jgi:polyphosphate kinase
MSQNKEQEELIQKSNFISRDLSWLRFNERVLDQARNTSRSILERLKFLAITASNLDEFMMIRVGSLYQYLDFQKSRIDYSGLREAPFKELLFDKLQSFKDEQDAYYENDLKPLFKKNGFEILSYEDISEEEQRKVDYYYGKTIHPMLTPMVFDGFHTFPIINNKTLTLGVITKVDDKKSKDPYRFSFVQIPRNLPRFFELDREGAIVLVPVETLIKGNVNKLFKNVDIHSVSTFRITRNGDFNYDDYDEGEVDFIDEIQKKIKKRKTGRVVRLEVVEGFSKKLLKMMKKRFELQDQDVFTSSEFLDFTSLFQLLGNKGLADLVPESPKPVLPLNVSTGYNDNLLEYLKDHDLMLHHPYNSMEPLLQLLDEAADDKDVLAIKITIYRLAEDSRVTNALLRAAEKGKSVSVLFEVKARFDEENNIKEGKRLQKAGCFVIYGVSKVKTHTKLLMIVRKDKNNIIRYTHMSSGNYNESTAKLYTDTSFMTTKTAYGSDVSEFFNVITGHSQPDNYKRLITTPGDMRKKLIWMIRKEATNAKKRLSAGIVIKVNSLEDNEIIDALYKASKAGVKVKLIVRGICCIRPGRKGVSENIEVKSIVGDYLEHSRIYYFHNDGDPKVYGGSADIMVRSFDRRIESLFKVEDEIAQQFINILDYNLKDEYNSYVLQEGGEYIKVIPESGKGFNSHAEYYKMQPEATCESLF